MTDLKKFQENVELLLKDEQFNIFPYDEGVSEFSKIISEFVWSDTENWKQFFIIAKKEGITTIFENVQKITIEDLDDNYDDDIRLKLKSNLNNISSVSFFWIKNNIKHTMQKKAPWFDEVEKQYSNLVEKEEKQEELNKPLTFAEQKSLEVPKNLSGKDPNDLAQELLEYHEILNPDFITLDRITNGDFWEEKEMNSYSIKHRNFQFIIENLAQKVIEKKEREKMPQLIEKCVEWALENKIDKPNQAMLKGFLAEHDIAVSPINFKILHTKVTLEIKKT